MSQGAALRQLTKISLGSPHDLLTRICARSCKDLAREFTRISKRYSHKDLSGYSSGSLQELLTRTSRLPQIYKQKSSHLGWTCILCRNVHGHVTRFYFRWKIPRKNAGKKIECPDQAPALTPTSRTPQCGGAVWGISER